MKLETSVGYLICASIICFIEQCGNGCIIAGPQRPIMIGFKRMRERCGYLVGGQCRYPASSDGASAVQVVDLPAIDGAVSMCETFPGKRVCSQSIDPFPKLNVIFRWR